MVRLPLWLLVTAILPCFRHLMNLKRIYRIGFTPCEEKCLQLYEFFRSPLFYMEYYATVTKTWHTRNYIIMYSKSPTGHFHWFLLVNLTVITKSVRKHDGLRVLSAHQLYLIVVKMYTAHSVDIRTTAHCISANMRRYVFYMKLGLYCLCNWNVYIIHTQKITCSSNVPCLCLYK